MKLQQRLRELMPKAPMQPTSPPRTLADLREQSPQIESEERARQLKEAIRRHEEALADLARREPGIWTGIDRLIESGAADAYDQVTQYLINLNELAQRRSEETESEQRLAALTARYRRRSGLIGRWRQQRLI